MDTNIEKIKALLASLTGIFIFITGESYKHILVLLLLMAVDTFIGWIKGIKLKEWKSCKARWGAVGKIAELLLIACLYALDWVFSLDFLKYIGIYYFGICEIASVFENFSEMGGNIPKGITELLKELQYSIGTDSVKKIKNLLDNISGGDHNENKQYYKLSSR